MKFFQKFFNIFKTNKPATRGDYPDGVAAGSNNDVVAAIEQIAGSGVVSAENSSTSTLASGATFTGSGVSVIDYASVVVAVKTDKDGTLYVDFSTDNSNWDSSLSYTVVADTNEIHRLSVTRRYFRVRFTNTSGQSQTYFRLQAIMGAQSPVTSPLNSSIQTDADALVTRSILTGLTPTSTFANQRASGYLFQTNTVLTSGQTYNSGVVDTTGYSQIQTELHSDVNGTLTGYWYGDADGAQLIRTFTRPFTASDGYAYFSSPIFAKYFRCVFTNGGSNQASFHFAVRTDISSISGQLIGLNDYIPSNVVVNLGRNVIVGQTDGGNFTNVPVTAEGHLEVALHAPRLPFGSIHVEHLHPVFQTDAVYGLNSGQVLYSSTLSGGVTTSSSTFTLSTGTTIYAQAQLQSRKRLRYRPGQGVVGRFTALFTTGVASSYQVAGFGHAEDGVYFGYKNADFGIIYSKRGVREIQTLTITTASNTNENVTVTLGGVAHSIAVTNSNNIQRTVWEIAKGTYTGWKAEPRGATVVFVADSVGNKTGTFSVAGTTIVGSFAETQAGSATTEEFIAQTDWNGDSLDGSGASGVTLDPTKGNVYQIGIQYLGFGSIEFKIEVTTSDANNADFVTVHTMRLPNTLTEPSFGNPSFPFTAAVYSAGSTTNLILKSASFAGFVEGHKMLHGNRFSYLNSITTAGASNFQALFTVINTRYYGSRSNQSVINILSVAGAVKHTQPVTFYLIKNGLLVGNPSFSSHATNSCSYVDTVSTSVTYSTNDQLVWSGQLGETGQLAFEFFDEITLQPGEWLTLAAKTATGTAAYVLGSMNTREDQ